VAHDDLKSSTCQLVWNFCFTADSSIRTRYSGTFICWDSSICISWTA